MVSDSPGLIVVAWQQAQHDIRPHRHLVFLHPKISEHGQKNEDVKTINHERHNFFFGGVLFICAHYQTASNLMTFLPKTTINIW